MTLFYPKELDRRIVEQVSRMPQLRSFWIWTDAALDELIVTLASAPNLWQLAVRGTLTDAGLTNPAAARNLSTELTELDLRGNEDVRLAAVERLSKVLLRCRFLVFVEGREKIVGPARPP